jgi:hypothetical protein
LDENVDRQHCQKWTLPEISPSLPSSIILRSLWMRLILSDSPLLLSHWSTSAMSCLTSNCHHHHPLKPLEDLTRFSSDTSGDWDSTFTVSSISLLTGPHGLGLRRGANRFAKYEHQLFAFHLFLPPSSSQYLHSTGEPLFSLFSNICNSFVSAGCHFRFVSIAFFDIVSCSIWVSPKFGVCDAFNSNHDL